MSVLRFSVRAARKTASIGGRALRKLSRFADKVESKATRILDGVDYSVQTKRRVSFEEVYYASIPHILPIHSSMPAVGSRPTVTLLIPTLDNGSFFGGTATALIVAAKSALLLDRKLRIVQTLKTGKYGDISVFFASEGLVVDDKNIQIISVAERSYDKYGYISTHPDDVFIASAWWDAHNLAKMPLRKKFIYLVQDFEPIFYNNSDQYVLAEETYNGSGFLPLCNTKLMSDFMAKRNYPAFDNVAYFEPAVSRISSGMSTPKVAGEKKVLFLYGRPNVHRNMFFTALQSIDLAFRLGFLNTSEWSCFMAGQKNLPDISLPSGVVIQNKGKMSMADYTSFSKTVDLAISPMMAPHPNYPTLEFASIGAAVVTTKYSGKKTLDMYSKNIIVSDLNVKSMAAAIQKAAVLATKERRNNLEESSICRSWDDSLDKVLADLLPAL